jgi:hypothetical protein
MVAKTSTEELDMENISLESQAIAYVAWAIGMFTTVLNFSSLFCGIQIWLGDRSDDNIYGMVLSLFISTSYLILLILLPDRLSGIALDGCLIGLMVMLVLAAGFAVIAAIAWSLERYFQR